METQRIKDFFYYVGMSILTGKPELVKKTMELKKKIKSLDVELEEKSIKMIYGKSYISLDKIQKERKYYELMRIKLYQIIKCIYQKNPSMNN